MQKVQLSSSFKKIIFYEDVGYKKYLYIPLVKYKKQMQTIFQKIVQLEKQLSNDNFNIIIKKKFQINALKDI